MAERLVDEIFAASDEQTVTVPGTDAAALIVPSLAAPSRTAPPGPAAACVRNTGTCVHAAGSNGSR